MPLDEESIYAGRQENRKSNCFSYEDCLAGGIGGEISALISEHCFEFLDAPVMRVASLNSPVPFAESIEKFFYQNQD